MVTQDSRESDVLGLIADLRTREDECAAKLEEIRRHIEAAQTVLALLRERAGIPATEQSTSESLVERVRGMTQLNALIVIAQASGGKLKVKEARRIFLQSGLKKNPKTASPGISSTLSRSDRFEWCAPGEYRLIERAHGKQTAFLRAS